MKQFSILALSLTVLLTTSTAPAEDIYAPMSVEQAKKGVDGYLESKQLASAPLRAKVNELWKDADTEGLSARQLLEKVVQSFALVDQPTQTFLDACVYQNAPLKAPGDLFDGLDFSNDFYYAQMNLYYGCYLAKRDMFDEALWSLEELDPKDLVDPASALFFRAVAQQQLFQKAEAIKSLEQLLQNTEDVPARYQTVATLMQYDLQQLKEKSLGHVAHKMNDSKRRLRLARGGQRVQKVQDEITILLDEIIEKLEQQAGGGGGSGSGSSQNQSNQSSAPADDSSVKGQTAPGNADNREFRDRNMWGKLPEKEEARADNIINRNFPSHYRKAIEEYSRRLAKQPQRNRPRRGSR